MAFEDIQPNEGKAFPDRHLAVYKNADGKLVVLSSICTHEECDVGWNNDLKEWECPCHGSRYTPDGHVVVGPAVEPLPPSELPQ